MRITRHLSSKGGIDAAGHEVLQVFAHPIETQRCGERGRECVWVETDVCIPRDSERFRGFEIKGKFFEPDQRGYVCDHRLGRNVSGMRDIKCDWAGERGFDNPGNGM